MRLTTRRAGGPLSLPKVQSTNCSIQPADVFREINKRFEYLEKRPTRAVKQPTSTEATIARSAVLSHFVQPSLNLSLEDLAGAG